MLTPEQTAIIKATVPLLETGGEALTKHFYKIMLGEYAEVRPLFNQAHQASGSQPRALANSVLQYARHIDNLGALGNLPAQIIQKHVSLQIQPEHYPIVGTCLLRAIREVLGAEIATDAVIEAWGAAYWQLANILIGAEKTQYDQQADAPGGWRGARQFRVARKVAESQEVRRNYSLSRAANGRNLRISVKRERGGLVSNFLHDGVLEGDVLEVFPPAGEFTLQPGTLPLALISGGVGITPLLAMAETALADGVRDVIFIHYARNGDVHAFGEQIDAWAKAYPQFRAQVVYEQGGTAEGDWPSRFGRPDIAHLEEWLPESRDCDAYFLGPKPFMAFIRKSLLALGLPEERIHFEFFGPAEALT